MVLRSKHICGFNTFLDHIKDICHSKSGGLPLSLLYHNFVFLIGIKRFIQNGISNGLKLVLINIDIHFIHLCCYCYGLCN